jgi:hypothetical protein
MRNQYGYGPSKNLVGNRLKNFLRGQAEFGEPQTLDEAVRYFEAFLRTNGGAEGIATLNMLNGFRDTATYTSPWESWAAFKQGMTSAAGAKSALLTVYGAWSMFASTYSTTGASPITPHILPNEPVQFNDEANYFANWLVALISPGTDGIHIGTGDTTAARVCAVIP